MSAATQTAQSGGGQERVTPMMRQYLEAKAQTPKDSILLFRMGDFYELFFDDAKIAARELDLTLTARDKGSTDKPPTPMAGVPHHAVSGYVARLIEKGYTVAICDQVEDPKTAKGIVKREITQLITPGTICELDALDPTSSSYIAHATRTEDQWFVVLLELLAGEMLVTRLLEHHVADEMRRMGVRELLVRTCDEQVANGWGEDSFVVRALDGADDVETESLLADRFGNNIDTQLGQSERDAIARLIHFTEHTQRRVLRHLMPPKEYRQTDAVVLDEATRRNLELCRCQRDDSRQGSLIAHLDKCRTAMGSRMLRHWMLFPLRSRDAIAARQDAVGFFASDRKLSTKIRQHLGQVRDMERLLGRVAVGRAHPKDLALLRDSLRELPALREALQQEDDVIAVGLLEQFLEADLAQDVSAELESALADEPPVATNQGGIFRKGYCASLDDVIGLSTEGHEFLLELERRERKSTGISTLKVRYNKVFGYYIEVSKANAQRVPEHYVRKQTLVNAERYVTEELKDFEEKVIHADEQRKTMEAQYFDTLLKRVAEAGPRLRAVSRMVAQLDALVSLGAVAMEGRYIRPQLVEEPVVQLTQGRHPVVETMLTPGERFVPNDVHLDATDRQMLLVTGPNMAGKSTVMRQTALCVLLAHMGSFVPAKAARVGLVDRIFTRVGASDNLGRGQSTFMVEMVETATILNHATSQSLVILDEVGRGTSTFDGVSIAWAVAEYLHNHVGARAMFATHYHELTDLARQHPRIINVTMTVKEHNERIVFLRELVDGAANRSYGIAVARLANLPEGVLQRAREVLANLEAHELTAEGTSILGESSQRTTRAPQLELFHHGRRTAQQDPAQPESPEQPQSNASLEMARVVQSLRDVDLDNLTPLEALNTLSSLRAQARDVG